MALVAGCASAPPTLDGFQTTEIDVGDESMIVAVAETSAQRTQGLRGVESLPAGIDGMIFVFGEPRSATFGMRDTRMPLDIWWFDDEGLLLGSARMEPCASVSCPGYASPGEVSWALETPAGDAEFSPGDRLEVSAGP